MTVTFLRYGSLRWFWVPFCSRAWRALCSPAKRLVLLKRLVPAKHLKKAFACL